jgi:hypothetical protein
MLTQLQTPIPLQTPKGKAWAIAIIDYGPDWDLLWVTFVHDSGECWTFNNREIRQEENYTFGHNHSSPIHSAYNSTNGASAKTNPTLSAETNRNSNGNGHGH